MEDKEKYGELVLPYDQSEDGERENFLSQSADLTFLIAVEDGHYRFMSVNYAFLNATKLSRERVEGKLVEEVIPGRYRASILHQFDLAVLGRQTVQWQDTFDYPDGKRTGVVCVTPVVSGQDICTMLVGSIHEITSQINKEKLIRAREEYLDLIYNTISDVVFLVSVEEGSGYRFIAVNHAFLNTTGLEREAVEGRLISEVVPDESLPFVLGKYEEAIRQRKMIRWEETSPYPSGLLTGIINLTPVFDGKGNCTMLVGSVHDITEQERIREEKDRVDIQLNNRVRELTTLFKVDEVFQGESRPVKELLKELAEAIQQGWQYPEITRTRISFGADEYVMPGFEAGVSRQAASFATRDGESGNIEVVYIDPRPDETEGPFLAEERILISSLAERLNLHFARIRAFEQLIKEKRLSDKIIETLPGLFYIVDAEGREIRWNKRKETLTGYSAEEIGQMRSVDFFPDEEKDKVKQVISDAFTTGGVEVELTILTKDGQKVPHYFNGVIIDYEGRPCLMGTGIDISLRKRMELELMDAEAKFRTLVEKSLVGVYIYQNGTFVYVNPRFAEIFGYDPEELWGLDAISTVIVEEFRPQVADYVEARLSGRIESMHYEVPAQRKDGRQIQVEFFGSRTIYAGEVAILGTMVDITERKLAEEALQRSEANLHSIFDATDTIYVLLDKEFQVQAFNERARYYMEREIKKEIRVQTSILSYFPYERHAIATERMSRVLEGQQVSYESSYQQKDGSLSWYFVRMFPIRNAESEVLGLMVAISDVSETKKMEQALLHQRVEQQRRITRAVLNAQERERNKIGQELHDNVNQILAGSKMCLGLTSNLEGKNEDLVAQSIQLIDTAINEIRALSSEQVAPERRIDLKEMIESLIRRLNDQSGISADFVYENEGVPVSDDLKLNIYRIIQECVNNIQKHSEAKSASFIVSVSKKALEVQVIDDGKGYDTSLRTKGIGISNMANRVESYNGTLRISSSPGNGCVLRMAVPF